MKLLNMQPAPGPAARLHIQYVTVRDSTTCDPSLNSAALSVLLHWARCCQTFSKCNVAYRVGFCEHGNDTAGKSVDWVGKDCASLSVSTT